MSVETEPPAPRKQNGGLPGTASSLEKSKLESEDAGRITQSIDVASLPADLELLLLNLHRAPRALQHSIRFAAFAYRAHKSAKERSEGRQALMMARIAAELAP